MPKLSEIYQNYQKNLKSYYLTQLEGEPWYKRSFYALACFITIFIKEINSLRLFTRVASGTYTTMLALVPFVVVGGSLILTFNKGLTVEELVLKINDFVLPVAGETISTFLAGSLERAVNLGLGPIGLISLLITSVMLFVHIEDAFNDIWHVAKPRAFWLRILLFYAIVTLGPLVIFYSIVQAAKIFTSELVTGFWWNILRETAVITAFCFVAFKFFPNTRVLLKNALIPAILISILLEATKYGFGFYMSFAFSTDPNSQTNYNILYGTIGIIPVTLLWIYLTWMLVLFGVETCYCLQNMRALRLQLCYDCSANESETWVFLGAYAAIEVLSALVRNFCAGRDPLTAEELAVECIYPVKAIEAILGRLESLNIVKSNEGEFAKTYFIARPLDTISIKSVMEAFDESSPRVIKHPKLDALVCQLMGAQQQIWAESNANILREDGVLLKDVSHEPTVLNLNLDESRS